MSFPRTCTQFTIAVLTWLIVGSTLPAQEAQFPAREILPEYEALLQRLDELEAEVSTIKSTQDAIKPANAEQLPPSPSVPGLDYGAMAPTLAPAPPKKYPFANVNGAFQADTVYFNQDTANRQQLGDIQDGADFRRTRLSASGSVAENVNYFVQMDFAFFGRPTFTDVWGEVTQLPVLGTVRAGQWKQPFSLEVPSSYRYQTFMERSVLFQSFEPFRHIGVGFYNNSADEMWTWASSVFRVGQDQYGGDIGDAGGWSNASRVTHLLWYNDFQDDCQRLEYLHLGAAYWFGDPASNAFQYRTIPEMFVGAFGVPAGTVPGTSQQQIGTVSNGTPPFVDTGAIPTNTFTHLGTEVLWAHGPFAWQTEAQYATVAQIGGPQLSFWGFYTECMYFLTGESKPYLRKVGQIDRIVPLRPFIREPDCEWGPGAWELAARVSHIDLDDENINGGRLTDVTLGVNWYLNPYAKVQFNYVRAMLNRDTAAYAGPSDANIVGLRFQTEF
jgi:phosphate-selective porin OprO/OprP